MLKSYSKFDFRPTDFFEELPGLIFQRSAI